MNELSYQERIRKEIGRSCQVFHEARIWFDAVREAGIPLVGNWCWGPIPMDEYVVFHCEVSCGLGCCFHGKQTPIEYRYGLRVSLGSSSNIRFQVQWVAKEHRWAYGPDFLHFDDVVYEVSRAFSPFICRHLLPMLEPSDLVLVNMGLMLLANPSLPSAPGT